MNKKSEKKCKTCGLTFTDEASLNKHKWSKHYLDEYQYYHSRITDWSNLPLAYKDDPYY